MVQEPDLTESADAVAKGSPLVNKDHRFLAKDQPDSSVLETDIKEDTTNSPTAAELASLAVRISKSNLKDVNNASLNIIQAKVNPNLRGDFKIAIPGAIVDNTPKPDKKIDSSNSIENKILDYITRHRVDPYELIMKKFEEGYQVITLGETHHCKKMQTFFLSLIKRLKQSQDNNVIIAMEDGNSKYQPYIESLF